MQLLRQRVRVQGFHIMPYNPVIVPAEPNILLADEFMRAELRALDSLLQRQIVEEMRGDFQITQPTH